MMPSVISILLWFAAIGCGLTAGLYFAFSAFIMTALGRIDKVHGLAAMNAINSTILRSLFMPLFWGTTGASVVLAGVGVFRWSEPGAAALIAGGAIYLAGMFLITVARNVPLNNALAQAEAIGADSSAIWARYLNEWTTWNHVRTVASTIASGLFVAALVVDCGVIE
jgi:uncharacterized membrane protein